jgi:ABC-type lipoprotein release transport system permease subunit
LSRLVGSLLVGVRPLDPWVLAAVPLVLGFVALAASAWPALRASRLDPVAGLRRGAR